MCSGLHKAPPRAGEVSKGRAHGDSLLMLVIPLDQTTVLGSALLLPTVWVWAPLVVHDNVVPKNVIAQEI